MGNSAQRQQAIVEICGDDLASGQLSELFRDGALAAILVGDSRVRQLWDGVSKLRREGDSAANSEDLDPHQLFLNLAGNHTASEFHFGDMMRFVPRAYGHFARKVIAYRDGRSSQLRTLPETGDGGDGRGLLDDQIVCLADELMSEVMESAWPIASGRPRHAVSIERLKYPKNTAELHAMSSAVADAGMAWTRLGHRLDTQKELAAGPFDTKFIRDLYAWSTLMPGIRLLVNRLNSFFLSRSRTKQAPAATEIIAAAHIDLAKYVTGMCGDRDSLRTQVFDGRDWLELPITRDTLTIIPSKKIESQGIRPTVHRVLIQDQSQGTSPNVTVILAALDHPDEVAP